MACQGVMNGDSTVHINKTNDDESIHAKIGEECQKCAVLLYACV